MSETIGTAILHAEEQLSYSSDAPRLEAELLLLLLLAPAQGRAYLWSRSEQLLLDDQYQAYLELVNKRCQGIPLAYLSGHREFWSLDLRVTTDTLIPRPETELLVELALRLLPIQQPLVIADLGTGSGAIALALANERPHWQIHATDISTTALAIAKKNDELLSAQRSSICHKVALVNDKATRPFFYQGSWCKALPSVLFDAIISNPPYLAANDPHLAALSFEPQIALVAGETGLEALAIIMQQARDCLKANGYLWLEHGYQQGEAVRMLMRKAGYHDVISFRDMAGHERVTQGIWGFELNSE